MRTFLIYNKVGISTALSLFVCFNTLAHSFDVDGIYYNITDKIAKTVEVTCKGSYNSDDSNYYSGSVTIPSSVTYSGTTYSVTSIGENAFEDCTGLTSVTIPNSVTTIGNWAFSYCDGLTSITIPNSVIEIGSGAFYRTGWYNNQADGILYLDNCCLGYKWNSRLTGAVSLKEGTRLIVNYAFYHCTGLTEISIPNSVTSIGDGAFDSCTDLTEVTIPNSVTSIGDDAFYDCKCLTNVNISDLSAWCKIDFGGSNANPLYYAKKLKLNGVKITNLVIPNDISQIKNYAFVNCSGLTEVTIHNSINEIGECAFSGCNSLTSITIPNSVTEIGGGAFSSCYSLTSVTIGNSVTSIGMNAFYGTGWYNNQSDGILYLDNYCLGYKRNKPTDILSIKEGTRLIGDCAFFNCSGMTEVSIPNSVTSIGDSAFESCDALTSVTIGNSVTSIGDGAFAHCPGLTSVTIPNYVSKIGRYAFFDCGLRLVYSYNTTPPSCADGAFGGDTNSSYSAQLMIPEGSKDAYANATEWNKFTNTQEIAGVEDPEADNNAIEIARYDIHGRLLTEPTKGINIIKMSDGSTRKEIIKE